MPPLSRGILLALVPVLGACGVTPPASTYPAPRSAQIAQTLDSLWRAETADDGRATPRIRLTTHSQTSPWIDASFHLSDDAYVLVVAVDRHRAIQVLYPTTGAEAGLVRAGSAHRLTRFFAGFDGAGDRLPTSFASFGPRVDADRVPAGTALLAVASDQPLQLERLIDGSGQWDVIAMRGLLLDRNVAFAEHALGRAVTLPGQEFNSDGQTFGGARLTSAVASYDSCEGYGRSNGYASGLYGFPVPLTQTYTIAGQLYVRHAIVDACGRVVDYIERPVRSYPRPPHDTTGRDSTTTVPRTDNRWARERRHPVTEAGERMRDDEGRRRMAEPRGRATDAGQGYHTTEAVPVRREPPVREPQVREQPVREQPAPTPAPRPEPAPRTDPVPRAEPARAEPPAPRTAPQREP